MKIRKIAIFVCLVATVLGVFYSFYNSPKHRFDRAVVKAHDNVVAFQNSFAALSQDETLISRLKESKTPIKEIEKHYADYLYIYHEDTLFFWNNNTTLPTHSIESIDQDGTLLHLKNGYYLGFKQVKGNYTLIGLQLLKTEFQIENKYLDNQYSPPYSFNKFITIESADTSQNSIVYTADDNPLFAVKYVENLEIVPDVSSLLISILTLFSFLVLNWTLIFIIKQKWGYFVALIVTITSFYLMEGFLTFIPFEFLKTTLFSPELYASILFGKSLGHIAIRSLFILICSYSFYQTILKREVEFNKWISIVFIWFFIPFVSLVVFSVIRSILLDSTISFDISQFGTLSYYSLVAVVVIMAILGILYYASLAGFVVLKRHKNIFLSFTVILIFTVAILTYNNFAYIGAVLAMVSFGFLLLLHFLDKKNTKFKPYNLYLLVIVFATLQGTVLIEYHNNIRKENDRKNIASQLARQRDILAEYQFNEIALHIKEDPFIVNYFSNSIISQKDLFQRINYIYFGGHLDIYNLNIFPFSSRGNLLRVNDDKKLEDFTQMIRHSGEETYSPSLFFIPKENGNFSYTSVLNIASSDSVVGSLVLNFEPKTYQNTNVYLDLISEGKNKTIFQENRYFDYAIYLKGKLNTQSGEYPYPYNNIFSKLDENKSITYNGYKHTLYSETSERKVVVSNPKKLFIIPISVFSYLFSFFIFLGFVFLLFYEIIFNINTSKENRLFTFSFRSRIYGAILSIIIGSFVIIGMITIRHFSEEHNVEHHLRLITKQKEVLSSIERLLNNTNKENSQNFLSLQSLPTEMAILSDIHAMDINIFDKEGSLKVSSQPKIFSYGLIAKVMNPIAFFTLYNEQLDRVIQEESIGNLKYSAIYVPIRDKYGEPIAYLNLPYFDKEKNLRHEISNFMMALVNVYTLLLIGAGVLGLIISRSITQPLSTIGEKLRLVNLRQKNEPIEWKNNDEIGALIQEYNKMISQLEQSAKLLAQSERESAWREMAKQIAHEIKNPLTPMKLSIQHLQRAVNLNPEESVQLTKKVAKTMIEQIDNLSEIANAFSSFAKMPQAKNEIVDIKKRLEMVVSLFAKEEDVELNFITNLDTAEVLVDKNQYVSVFNNLVKNAIQATEEKKYREINVYLEKESDFFKVRIEDNGTGIKEEMYSKVFVPNFTTKSSGTGLGLAISKNIIENSGGAIWFESIYGKGTTFSIIIPQYFDK